MIARIKSPSRMALITVSVLSDSHKPFFSKGECLTVDPNLLIRVEDFGLVESDGVSILCRAYHSSGGSVCYREVSQKQDGPEVIGSPLGRVVKREAAGSGADGITWTLPLFEASHGTTYTSFPRFDPEVERVPTSNDTDRLEPLLYHASAINTAMALYAEEEKDNESAFLLCMAEIQRSPMAALVLQEYVADCGAPPSYFSLLMLVARFFRAGELCAEETAKRRSS